MIKLDLEELASRPKYCVDTNQKARVEVDSLQGNINRMFVTDDPSELDSMYKHAIKRIELLYAFHKERLNHEQI